MRTIAEERRADLRRRLLAMTLGLVQRLRGLPRLLRRGAEGGPLVLLRDLLLPRPRPLAPAPPGSGLRPVLGDADAPVVGSVLALTGDRVAWGMRKRARYGPLWWSMVAGRRFVQVTGAAESRRVLVNADKAFSQDGWVTLIAPFFGGGLMLRSFGEHLDHRRTMQAAFTPARLAGYLARMDARATEELATWEDGTHLLHPRLKDLGLRVATDVFLGLDLPPRDRQRVLQWFHGQARAPMAALRLDLPGTLWGRGRSGYDHVTALFREHIDQVRATPGDDLFSAMATATDDDGERFTDEEVAEHLNFLWFAAHDTTNLAMTMTAWGLAAHPVWQERARAEVLALPDGPLTPTDLAGLEALDLVLREALRLWPPVPAALRRTVVDTEVEGYWLPRGTWVGVFPVVTHRLAAHWDDPHTFDPSRFVAPRAEPRGSAHAYLPFGAGAHKCIGMAFAELEVKAVLARLLRSHELHVPAGYVPPIRWSALPEPADGLPVRVVRRAPRPAEASAA